ncbi:MAG: hypothetical protein AAB074_22635 [Planctomycetota bacterium]
MKPILALVASLPLLSGCAILFRDPTHVDFRAAVGADDWPRVALEPLQVPSLELPRRPSTADEIRVCCGRLGDDDPDVRDQVTEALAEAGEAALPALRAIRERGESEAAARAGQLIERILFGDVDALRTRLRQNSAPDAPFVVTLEPPLDLRMDSRHDALEILSTLQMANRGGAVEDPDARQARIAFNLMGLLVGSSAFDRAGRRRAAGYDDPRDPVAMTAFARIVRYGLRSPDRAIQRAALGTASLMGGIWEAALFPDMIAIGRDANDALAEEALLAVAAAARAGAEDIGPALVRDFGGTPPGPTNVSQTLRPWADLLVSIAEDTHRPMTARAAALEAACYSGEARLSLRIQALCEVPGLKFRAFQAIVALGGPEADEAILRALGDSFGEVGAEEAVSAAVRRGTRAAIPLLAKAWIDSGLGCAAIGAIATADDLGEILFLLESRITVEEVRPLFGALVRFSPLPEPYDARARRLLRDHLRASVPNVRFLAACALSAMDVRAGIAAWGSRLEDEGVVTVTWPGFETGLPMWAYACGGLSQLSENYFQGEHDDQREQWKEWWEEHAAEFETGDAR